MALSEAYPLILFTLLSGTAFGLWVTGAALGVRAGNLFRVAGWLATILQLASVVVSTLHLALPLAFYRALINWQASWLTREVWFAGVFLVVMAVCMILFEWTRRGKVLPNWLVPTLVGLAALLGLGMTLSSGMSYMDAKGIPGWVNPALVFFFPMTGLAVGLALGLGLWLGRRAEKPVAESKLFVAVVLALAVSAALAIWAVLFAPGTLGVGMTQWQSLVLALLLLVAWVLYLLMLVKPTFLAPLWVWIAFVALAVSVVLTRVWFYGYAVHM